MKQHGRDSKTDGPEYAHAVSIVPNASLTRTASLTTYPVNFKHLRCPATVPKICLLAYHLLACFTRGNGRGRV